MTYDEISRLSPDEAKRDLREARRKLATALDLVQSLNAENETLLVENQRLRASHGGLRYIPP